MIVYGDRRERLTPALALARLHEALAAAAGVPASSPAGDGARRHDALVELVIEAGLLEQAVADALCPHDDGAAAVPAPVTRLTDLAALAVARSCPLSAGAAASPFGGPPLPLPRWWQDWRAGVEALLDDLARGGLPPAMEAILPEGYLFYALYPEAYLLRVRQALAGQGARGPLERDPHVVIGLRSIGTSLGAMAAAGCRDAGLPVHRFSMRPRGDCFSRRMRAAPALVGELRALRDQGARFVIVDEGPGLSGSSLAGAALFLREEVAVAPARIAFLCANAWPGCAAPAWVLRQWRTIPRWIVDGDFAAAAAGAAARLGDHPEARSGATSDHLTDLSGGAWRGHVGLPRHVATSHPRFERRKYLDRAGGGTPVWAKFIGLGRHGRLKAARAAHLAVRGFVPPVRGYAHGFLLSLEVAAPPLSPGQHGINRAGPGDLARIASYYAYLAALDRPDARVDGDEDERHAAFGRLCAMVAHNTRAWFGATLDAEVAALDRWRSTIVAGGRAGGDGKPQPYEWLAARPLLKGDAADHHLDHGPVWPLDPCYDLAGTIREWSLDTALASFFVQEYMAGSDDHGAWERLPFYQAVYAAALLGQHDMAYHLESAHSPASAACHDGARRRYAEMLREALAHGRRCAADPQPIAGR